MTFKEWVDLFTGGGAAISAIAAGVAAWAARTSAGAAKESSAATRAAIYSNEQIAENDRRIRLMEERMKVWRTYDDLMGEFALLGSIKIIKVAKANEHFQLAPFLFPSEIDNYLKQFSQIAKRHGYFTQKLERNDDEDAPKRAAWEADVQEMGAWLKQQQYEGKNLFKKYMSLID